LEAERKRLVQGVITGSIPDDLAREQQERIGKELANAQAVMDASTAVFPQIEDACAVPSTCSATGRTSTKPVAQPHAADPPVPL